MFPIELADLGVVDKYLEELFCLVVGDREDRKGLHDENIPVEEELILLNICFFHPKLHIKGLM